MSKTDEKTPEKAVEDDGKTEVTTRLTGRHHAWLDARARMDGRSPGQQLEKIVREAWANDPYKKEVVSLGTDVALGGSMPAADFKP